MQIEWTSREPGRDMGLNIPFAYVRLLTDSTFTETDTRAKAQTYLPFSS